MQKKDDVRFISAVEKGLNILDIKEKINNKDYAKALISDWENVLKKNKFQKNRDLLIKNAKGFNVNYFDLAHKYGEEFVFNPERQDVRLFQKMYASYNLASKIPFDTSNNGFFDTQTSLGYIGLSKIFYTYRFLENFVDYFLILENKQLNKRDFNTIRKKELKDKHYALYNFFNSLDRHPELTQMFQIVKDKRNSNGENIFSYIDKKQGQIEHSSKRKAYIIDILWLVNDLRNLFVHSQFSASSGSGDPLVTFIFTTHLSDVILKRANEFFKNEVLIKKYGYKF